MSEEAAPEHTYPSEPGRPVFVLVAVVITMLVATAASYGIPKDYAATAVGLTFLGATYWLVLRYDAPRIESYGLGFAGFFEPTPLPVGRMARAFIRAAAWAIGCLALVAPLFVIGYRKWAEVDQSFDVGALLPVVAEVPGQLLVVALPEEAFFRGFLQTELERILPRSPRFLGVDAWWSIILTSAVFSLGHFVTLPYPARLAVFFPSLLFGFLRKRTGGIGASCLFHASCNLLSSTLAHGYGR